MQSDLSLQDAIKLRDAGKVADALIMCREILQHDPRHGPTLYFMGTLAHQLGAMDIAIEALQGAATSTPRSPEIRIALGRALAAAKRTREALKAFKRAIELRPTSVSAHRGLGQVQLDLGMAVGAAKSFEVALSLRPDDLQSAYFARAIKTATASTRSNDYVPALFDAYADQFDVHLTRLGYRLPEVIRTKLEAFGAPEQPRNALDLGCGTGLVALAIHDLVETIDGLDVSAAMIEKARNRDLYRALAVGDATDRLRADVRFAAPYDVIIAADVFIYIGGLDAIFAAVAEKLAPDGVFLFSTESTQADDVVIQGSGRFAHSASYIDRLAALHGLTVKDRESLVLREEFGTPVPGEVYTLGYR